MTESGKQRLRLLSIAPLLVSAFFWLEGRTEPGWKTGMALLPIAVLAGIDSYIEKKKFFRILFIGFCLFFLLFSIKNFLAP